MFQKKKYIYFFSCSIKCQNIFPSFQTTVDMFISKWAIEGVHLSLAKQDMLGANVN